MITKLEELSLNAWASHQTVLYDGWVLRFANGYTKRANSINPLYASSLDLAEKMLFCENTYRKKNLPVVFKITPAVHPTNLDESLAVNGYLKDSPTSVQLLALGTANLQMTQALEVREDLTPEWLDGFCRMNAVSAANKETLRQILLNIVPRHCFVSLRSAGEVLACGLGVVQSGYIGLFDIVTDGAFRRRGFARQVVRSILAWGQQNQARTAYLQVMLNNTPALHLYSSFGFRESYQYWYRIKP